MYKIILLVFIPICWSKHILTLDDAIAIAFRNNPDIQYTQKMSTISKYDLLNAEYQFGIQPSVDFSGGFSKDMQTSSDGNSKSIVKNNFTLTPSLNWNSPIGTHVNISAPVNFAEHGSTASGTITITQPILKGFNRDIVLAGLYTARDNDKMAIDILKNDISIKIIDVIKDYRSLIVLNNSMKIALDTFNQAENDYKSMKLKFSYGTVSQNDLYSAESRYEEKKYAFFEKKKNKKEKIEDFADLLGIKDIDFDIPENIDVPDVPLPDRTSCEKLIFENGIEWKRKVLNLKQANSSLIRAKDDMLPQLDLKLSLSSRTSGNSVDSTTSINPVIPLDLLFKGKEYSIYSGFYLKFPLVDYSGKKNLLSSQYNQEKIAREMNITKRKLTRQVQNAIDNIENNLIRLNIKTKLVSLKKKEYELNKKQYSLGKISRKELIDSDESYIMSLEGHIKDKITYLNSLDALDFMLGLVLEKRSIKLNT